MSEKTTDKTTNKTMKLSDLITEVKAVKFAGRAAETTTAVPPVEVKNLCFDSRRAAPGTVFFAVKGSDVDGHAYIPQAVAAGAVAVVCEDLPSDGASGNDQSVRGANSVCYLQVPNSAAALGQAASIYYGRPSEKLVLVGVTGTNGKTTIATLLYRLFRAMGHRCGLLSTIENRIEDTIIPSTHTTGDALEINRLLAQMVEAGCTHAFMEVSSHAIVQERIAGLQFRGGIFTNLTRDHLDYHKTFKAYIEAKKLFFDRLPSAAFALVNTDDVNGRVMVQNTAAQVKTYALQRIADFQTKVLENNLDGLCLLMNGTEVYTRLVGDFNAYNLTAIYGTACLLGEEPIKVLTALSGLAAADGRFQPVKGATQQGIVDYAHTPDALENVLSTLDGMKQDGSRLLCVVGCGGNRDSGKRPMMAETAARYADLLILTSDNPRFEDPQSIIDQMYVGVPAARQASCLCILSREEAIKTACLMAQPGDLLLVAGKGHETYQEIEGVKHPFDDREMLKKYLK